MLMRRKRDNNSKKYYKPNTKLYMTMAIIALVIRISPFFIGFNILNNIFNELSIGVIGSALFAWLVDWSDCSKRNKEKDEKERMIFSEYNSSILELKFFLAKRCMFLTKTPMVERTFAQWLFMYTDISSYAGIDDPEQRLQEQYETLSKRVKYVYDAICALKQHYFVLVSEDFVDTGDLKQHLDYQSNLCLDIFDYITDGDYSNANDIIKQMVENHDSYFEKDYEKMYNGKGLG